MLRVLLQRVRPMTLRTFVQLVSLMPILGALVWHGIAQADPSVATDSWQVVLAAGDDAQPVFDNATHEISRRLVAAGVRRAISTA